MSSRYCEVQRVSRLHKWQRTLLVVTRLTMNRILAAERARQRRWKASQRGDSKWSVTYAQ